jgi:hemerythrin
MAITWNPALETGNPVIDAQHKELIKAINNLLDACQQGQAKDKAGPTLDFLISYTKKHFAEEESLQLRSNYPDFQNHRKLHESLLKTVSELAAEMKNSGPTPVLVNKLVRNVGDWLVSHIKKEDAKVAAHIKNSG